MDRTGWRLTDDDLRGWLDGLLERGRRLIAPVEVEEGLRLFRPVESADRVRLEPGKTRWSPKDFLFSQTETLYRYSLEPDGPRIEDPELPEREQVLVGVRCCDAAGFCRLDEVFLSGKIEDPFYGRRRELTVVVALACSEAQPECFCTAVGGSPMGTDGADLLLVRLRGDWLLSPVTERGEALAVDGWPTASPEDWSCAERQERDVSAQIARDPIPAGIAAALERNFDSPVWKDLALRCLSCSICAYACPSCSCFDVHHEGNAWGGRELRCWDACTFPLFTLHASGHNPRGGPDARYRQRALHKFAYLEPGQEGVIRCTGCGRCNVHCPVGIDIHDAVMRIAASRAEGGSADG
jgi:formate hydrogenlyase subunit 6/NADH:ubiquinone oxidoreductase subunit I